MNKKVKNNIPTKKDWQLYLERKIPLFTVAAFIKPYSIMLDNATGFQFIHKLFVYKKDTCSWYYSAQEMKQADKYYINLIHKRDTLLKKWAKLGERYNQEANELINKFTPKNNIIDIKENYNNILKQCQNIMLYGTVIPYRILSAIDSVTVNGIIPKAYNRYYNLFKTLRAETRYPQINNSVFKHFWKTVAKLTRIKNYSLFSYTTPQELNQIIMHFKKPNLQELKIRKQGCIFWNDKTNKIHFNYDDSVLEKIGLIKILPSQITKLKGNIAQRGIVRGRVRIINHLKEMEGFRKGDIIVSINTNPSLMPVIVKCGGIITDEGGIMCHAAIVSRELKIPCIIGTKIAIKVLKDGDLVEVDANKGVVKILKR